MSTISAKSAVFNLLMLKGVSLAEVVEADLQLDDFHEESLAGNRRADVVGVPEVDKHNYYDSNADVRIGNSFDKQGFALAVDVGKKLVKETFPIWERIAEVCGSAYGETVAEHIIAMPMREFGGNAHQAKGGT